MSNHPALDAQYRKVIPGRYTTKRDGSPMLCNACAAPLVAGETLAATTGEGWHSYCTHCAASYPAFVKGLFARVTSLDPTREVSSTTMGAVRAFVAEPERSDLFLAAVDHLNAERRAIGEARKDAPAGGLDLSTLVSGKYAVPGGDTRLKVQIDVVEKGKWEGWVFVKDAAVYGEGQRYGSQRPGATYKGKIEAQLRIIAADPVAAMAEYGHLTNTCGKCGLPLEDAESVARGIGPICARKLGIL